MKFVKVKQFIFIIVIVSSSNSSSSSCISIILQEILDEASNIVKFFSLFFSQSPYIIFVLVTC
jgi:hypothetical protein